MTSRGLRRLVGQNLRRGRRAFVLSVFGISVGIASLAFFLALSSGVRHVVIGKVFPVGQLEIVPPKSSLDTSPLSLLSMGEPRALTDETANTLRKLPQVKAVYRRMRMAFPGRAWGGAALLGKDVFAEAIIEGVDPAAMTGESLGPEPFSDGLGSQIPCDRDDQCHTREYCPWDTHKCERPIPATLSPFMLELYNGALAPSHGLPKIGNFLASRFRGFIFNVELGRSFFGGAPKSSTGAQPTQRRIMLVGISPHASQLALTLPLAAVQRWNALYAGERAAHDFSSLLVELHPDAGARGATEVAAEVRRLGFQMADTGAERASLAITLATLLFALISFSIVLIAAVNIAHSFFRAVAERRREIGTLRAIGATASDIRRIILAEAAVIGLFGGVLGLGIARLGAFACDFASSKLVPDFPFKPDSYFSFDWPIVVGALVCAIAACMLGALWPALRASRLDPAEALSS